MITPHGSSTGQALTGPSWLDVHFDACQPEYEALLRQVPIERGWRVIDAGCGSGSYLPLLADMVGPTGAISAVDLAAENIAVVRDRASRLACPVEARTASLLALPDADNSFDALWCANVVQYVADADLPALFAEFRRVVRPGGIIAIKDVDMQLFRLYPIDQFLVTHLAERCQREPGRTGWPVGSLRGRTLRRLLEQAGFREVRQHAMLIERWAPLRPVERRLYTDWLAALASFAGDIGVPAADAANWRTVRDPDADPHPVDSPDFYACEGQVVAYGRVS